MNLGMLSDITYYSIFTSNWISTKQWLGTSFLWLLCLLILPTETYIANVERIANAERPVLSHSNNISPQILSSSQTYMIKTLVTGIQVAFGSVFSMS